MVSWDLVFSGTHLELHATMISWIPTAAARLAVLLGETTAEIGIFGRQASVSTQKRRPCQPKAEGCHHVFIGGSSGTGDYLQDIDEELGFRTSLAGSVCDGM